MKIKYMTLKTAAKKSLCFLILMVLYDQLVFAFVYCDCLSSDQVLDVWKKHILVSFLSEYTYMNLKVKKVGFSNSPSSFFTMLISYIGLGP